MTIFVNLPGNGHTDTEQIKTKEITNVWSKENGFFFVGQNIDTGEWFNILASDIVKILP